MQLRSAKKFGFDFEKHSTEKVGVIRSFVRKKKDEERKRISTALASGGEKDGSDISPAKPKTISSKMMEPTAETKETSEKTSTTTPSTRRGAKRVTKAANPFKPKVEKVAVAKQIFRTSQRKAV